MNPERREWLRRRRRRRHEGRPIGSGVVPLSVLAVGERGRVVSIDGVGRSRRRLLDLGFVTGEDIVVERVAPLGDPMEIIVKGYHLSLRRAEVSGILVEVRDA